MKFNELHSFKLNRKFQKYDKYLKLQQLSIEQHSLEHGRIFIPIFIWKETNEIIYGHTIYNIAQKFPELELIIIEIPFKDWQEAEAWVVDHILSQPSVSLWDKLELAVTCEHYWEIKELAKRSQGKRNDLSSAPEDKLPPLEVNRIIADKVSCGVTMVSYFKTIYHSRREEIIEKCREGNLSISTAYENHFAPENKGKSKTKPKSKLNPPFSFEILNNSFFDGSKDVVSQKIVQSAEKAPDPQPVIDKLVKAKISEGHFWISLDKKTGAIQFFRKIVDEDKGVVQIKVDSFGCILKDTDDDRIIFEASYYGNEPFKRKDESDFEKEVA